MIAGIKEGLYDAEPLATYLLYRLNVLDPVGACSSPSNSHPVPPLSTSTDVMGSNAHAACPPPSTAPAYLDILPPGTPPTTDIEVFLDALGRKLGMLGRGGIVDHNRAAVWFLGWWRNHGARIAAKSALPDAPAEAALSQPRRHGWGFDLEWTVSQEEAAQYDEATVQRKMEECMENFEAESLREEQEGGGVSSTQLKKKAREEELARRARRISARLSARKG